MTPKKLDAIKSLGGLKTFELWLTEVAGITDPPKLMAPLFVLYDLRVVLKHRVGQAERVKTLNKCVERLGILASTDYERIYDALTSALIISYDYLLTARSPKKQTIVTK